MTKKPHDTKLQEEAENAIAVNSEGTEQEFALAEAKRQAEADLAATHRAGADASPSRRSHPKVHRSEEEGAIQDAPGEPKVEDES